MSKSFCLLVFNEGSVWPLLSYIRKVRSVARAPAPNEGGSQLTCHEMPWFFRTSKAVNMSSFGRQC